jgi:hypothetical protein
MLSRRFGSSSSSLRAGMIILTFIYALNLNMQYSKFVRKGKVAGDIAAAGKTRGWNKRHRGNPDNLGRIPAVTARIGNRVQVGVRIIGTDDHHLVPRLYQGAGKRVHRYGNTVHPGPIGIGKHNYFHTPSIYYRGNKNGSSAPNRQNNRRKEEIYHEPHEQDRTTRTR